MALRQTFAWCPVSQCYRHMYVDLGAKAARLGHGRKLVTAYRMGGGGMQSRGQSATAEGNR